MAPDELVERVVGWASARDDVRGAVLVGSRARVDHPADEHSDVDVILVVRDAAALVDDPAWVAELGEAGITFVEQTGMPTVVRERRVLYTDGTDVDFVVVGVDQAQVVAEGASGVFARGVRVLVDKGGMIAPLLDLPPRSPTGPPSEKYHSEAVADFWYHVLWTARKLARGEVFTAKSCCDSHLKWLLVRMLEWHAENRDTWHDGRFLEEWANDRALAELRQAYATYDGADVKRALLATMELFSWVARETGDQLGYGYPADEEELARRLTLATLR